MLSLSFWLTPKLKAILEEQSTTNLPPIIIPKIPMIDKTIDFDKDIFDCVQGESLFDNSILILVAKFLFLFLELIETSTK
ncbi:hypothetical protein Q5M85_20860 [Paraclostridium bifermentans]|nr:hypothetical protein [Paraclostridium bifermentans]